mmetsp:Transcript_28717/g.53810  ORF Transcript_28717/g.53810 Transcript_28717/m.53810 type:complete len:90 (-) Transcript_28717:737-1006(-)
MLCIIELMRQTLIYNYTSNSACVPHACIWACTSYTSVGGVCVMHARRALMSPPPRQREPQAAIGHTMNNFSNMHEQEHKQYDWYRMERL